MAKANVVFTKDNEYYTPKYVVDLFGKFDYDPATTPNNLMTKQEKIILKIL
jgi:hypothetical protein